MEESALGRHRAMLHRFLLFLLRDPEAADELAQETFRVALTKGADPAKGANHGAWLRSIARNLVRNHIRKRRNCPLLFHSDILERAEARFVETRSDEDDAWEARRQALAACMQRLPEPERDLLRRRYERGEQVKHMASRLGLAPNSLSKRLERIRTKLRDCIEAALREQPRE